MPSSSHFVPASPAASLETELQAASELLALLQQEQQQLVDANIAELERLSEEKSVLVTQLARLAGVRHHALAATGYQATESGMQYWVETQAGSEVDNLWQSLLETMRSAQEANRTNGLLINAHLGRNHARLNALQPQSATTGSLYGPSGHSSTRLSTRGLIIG